MRDVSLSLGEGEALAILGPSGCGKTTLLRLIAGLEAPDAGEVRFQGRSLAGLPPEARDFGLMFQDLALFPHLDVFENVAFGLRTRRWPAQALRERVEALLALLRLQGMTRRQVHTLSGGERQRVALARSLAPHPRLLMLDEPLGALDRALRSELAEEVRRVLREAGVASLYVTHDQEEAFAIADRVLVMAQGRVAQEGRPEEVYARPASAFVARFLGHRNLIPAVTSPEGEATRVESPLGSWLLPLGDPPSESPCTLLIPPGALALVPADSAALTGVVLDVTFQAGRYRIRLLTQGGELTAEASFPLGKRPAPGATVGLAVDLRAVRLLPWTLEETA